VKGKGMKGQRADRVVVDEVVDFPADVDVPTPVDANKSCKICSSRIETWPMAHRGDRCCSQLCEKELELQETPHLRAR
jgi:hypothetical protein